MDTKVDPNTAIATETTASPQARTPLPVPEFPPRVLLDLVTDCNLKCPMCIVHGGTDDPRLQNFLKKSMTVENAKLVLDEIMAAKPLLMPNMWSEPLMIPSFKDHIRQMKERGLTVAMNTNGLKMNAEMAQFLVDIKFDSVFFSVDAMTPETLKKVRGITRLDLLHKAVDLLMTTRGANALPRIGVSMTLQDTNRHEREAFVEFWTQRVDAVRVGEIFEVGGFTGFHAGGDRVPCQSLYTTMAINTNGNVSMCCLDGFNEYNMGNVFKDGVKGVWHGPKLTSVRRLHERGQWDKIPLCKTCDRWASYAYEDVVQGDLLIRRSAEFTYYNRIDRMKNWHKELHGTHGDPYEKLKEPSCAS
jgi:radical SAM protein with 4Fe4S-binding SPASM domain